MRPSFSATDQINVLMANAKSVSYITGFLPVAESLLYLRHVIGLQYSVSSPPQNNVSIVVGMGADYQMSRINANPNIARMAHAVAIRPLGVFKEVCKLVGKAISAKVGKFPVSFGLSASGPKPACVRFSDLAIKSGKVFV